MTHFADRDGVIHTVQQADRSFVWSTCNRKVKRRDVRHVDEGFMTCWMCQKEEESNGQK